jgi:hypothetical protein
MNESIESNESNQSVCRLIFVSDWTVRPSIDASVSFPFSRFTLSPLSSSDRQRRAYRRISRCGRVVICRLHNFQLLLYSITTFLFLIYPV